MPNNAQSGSLPNWLMIGAPRTGSTALDEALRRHPDFFLPQGKETHFFSHGGDTSLAAMQALKISYRVVSTQAEYNRLFEGAAAFSHRGEVDPSILACARYAAPKIRATLGETTQFIVVLRQPVERAYSHYLLHRRANIEHGLFESYVPVTAPRTSAEKVAIDRYFRDSFYFDTLRVFLDAFAHQQFLFLLYDDLQADPHSFMRQILEFLNADTRNVPTLQPETNAGKLPTRFRGRFHTPQHPLRRFLRAFVPRTLRAGVRTALKWKQREAEGYTRPPLDPAVRERLMVRYHDDILRTQALIQRDLSHWLN